MSVKPFEGYKSYKTPKSHEMMMLFVYEKMPNDVVMSQSLVVHIFWVDRR